MKIAIDFLYPKTDKRLYGLSGGFPLHELPDLVALQGVRMTARTHLLSRVLYPYE